MTGTAWDGAKDLPHVGALCARVRRSRDLRGAYIARIAGISQSTVHRFETTAAGGDAAIAAYIGALGDSRVAQPLGPEHRQYLLDAVDHSRHVREREQELAGADFAALRSGAPDLDRLIRQLADSGLPGGIYDCLGFVHVRTRSSALVMGVQPTDPFLGHWFAWHFVSNAIAPGSPLLAQSDPAEEAPRWAARYAQVAQRYLFTAQSNALIWRLCELQPVFFPGAWRAASSMLLTYDAARLAQSAALDGAAAAFRYQVLAGGRLEVAHGLCTEFHLGVWSPMTDASRRALDRMAPADRSQLLFAADFDKAGDMHVNHWPGVAKAVSAD